MPRAREKRPDTPYRVLADGPHVGLGGCGMTLWFETLKEATERAGRTFCCTDAYPVMGQVCDGECTQKVVLGIWDERAREYIKVAVTERGTEPHVDGQLW